MKDRIRFWISGFSQVLFGLLIGFFVGFLFVIKPKGGGGLLRRSDTLPFVLGMGFLFVAIVREFCRRMDRGEEFSISRDTGMEKIKNLRIDQIFSIIVGIVGISLIVISFLKTLKILAR